MPVKRIINGLLPGFGVAAVLGVLVMGATALAGNPPPPKPAPVATEAPTTTNPLTKLYDGFKWGMTHAEVAKVHNQTNGVFDSDYNPVLAKMQPGVKMQALEAERENKKVAFTATWIEFKDTPTGYDQTAIKDEYTYKNKESVMYVDRDGRRRYFFFIGDRLWKIYDEVALGDTGVLGKTFQDVVNKLNGQLGVSGRILAPDKASGRTQTTVDWQDTATHLRAVDRGAGSCGIVLEDRSTLGNLAQLRANKMEDPLAMDPAIAAATRGQGRSDPNAAKADSGAPKKK
jgi:hypothetical protein